MSSADNLCKQFGSRSGLTKCQALTGSKLFDTSDGIPEKKKEKLILNKLANDKKVGKI